MDLCLRLDLETSRSSSDDSSFLSQKIMLLKRAHFSCKKKKLLAKYKMKDKQVIALAFTCLIIKEPMSLRDVLRINDNRKMASQAKNQKLHPV